MADDAADTRLQGPVDNQNPNSVDAQTEPGVGGGPAESICNNNASKSSDVPNDDEREKTLEFADELMARGSKAAKDRDYAEATDCYSRALEIRVAKFGELAPECIAAYYKYGCALLYKAQEESDPLASMPKKEGVSREDSSKESSSKIPVNDVKGKDEEGDSESDGEDQPDDDEDESDLDLAWKMLDVARAIAEMASGDTMEKVDILSALAEVALEREDVETSQSDYLKALSMLERLVEPDSRLIAELNFRICLCLEIGSKPEEAVPYCQKAISVCKSRVQRLSNEAKSVPCSAEASITSEMGPTVQPSLAISSSADEESEIETLTGLCGELEKKLEDLQQLVSNPKSILSDILGGIISAKARALEKNEPAMSSSQMGTATNGGADSPTVSTAHTNGAAGVTHLGVVGRGVKRVVMSSTAQSNPAKKPAIDSSNDGDGGSEANVNGMNEKND
ncbi:NASP-related protein sim3-like isoform X2 [Salvia miltiorrhiza]|uniref:NASP-related protein sim3-like isoform X2 n=1 Tax=Salvia miltiorrhiza TaxID=226208 RepID=UPI0025AC2CC4|nr:NASP-related protein sim3-like isoform X2 [Salvia miltiorrhiza]